MKNWLSQQALYLAWAIALAGMAGSLYFSEFAGYAPCILCWYQRIALYPLVAILPVGILKRDKLVSLYALPLSIIGGLIALYHNFLQWHLISEKLAPCTLGVSCVTNQFTAYGFITIPLLSLIAFGLITWLMFLHRRVIQHD